MARVHLFPNGTGAITINGRNIDDYFGLETLKLIVRQPLATTDTLGKVDIEATVTGGGVTGQAGAIRHGVARALLLANEEFRPKLAKETSYGELAEIEALCNYEGKDFNLKMIRINNDIREPVSYTHLDVYKRQPYFHKYSKNPPITRTKNVASFQYDRNPNLI